MKSPTEDQQLGLEFAIGQLKESFQEVLRLHYEKGLTYKEVGEQTGRSSSRCGQISRIAIMRLKHPNRIKWIIDGYQGSLGKLNELAEEARVQFLAEGKSIQADMMVQSPEILPGITAQHAKLLMNVGITNIGVLREVLKEDFWTRTIPGIGDVAEKKIVYAMYHAGIIDESFESYKELSDRAYCQEKFIRMREED
ncbi:MAG: sigma factor-like helix-turn-helix DNA-binding protein [Lachnospiraceae bacterium]|nr:sigma factor-like helix-turn-helix DNA-binding protein [Lachnospiraceae bacterium]